MVDLGNIGGNWEVVQGKILVNGLEVVEYGHAE